MLDRAPNHTPLFSIVVPVYNVEKYLARCLKSIDQQSFSDYEVILVDDGSTDLSSEICDEWCLSHARFSVLHKPNEGLGFARNSGLVCANGRYIVFIDSDDYIEDDLLLAAQPFAKANSDLIVFGYDRINKQGLREWSAVPDKQIGLISSNSTLREEILPFVLGPDKFGHSKGLSPSACTLFYRKLFLLEHDLQFRSERELISEDIYFALQVFEFACSFAAIPNVYYHYCENQGSLSKSYKTDRFQLTIDWYVESIRKCAEAGYSSEVLSRMHYCFINNVVACVKSEVQALSSRGFSKTMKSLRAVCESDILRSAIRSYRPNSFSWEKRLLLASIERKAVFAAFMLLTMQIRLKHK